MKRMVYVLLLSAIFGKQAKAQAQPVLNGSDILLGLEKLNTVGAVLYIAAHPDDENTRLLAYLAKEKKLRTGYLSVTRGDGGQNLIGKEQGDALGLIRTQELLAARRTDGAEQFFTRANDFGYSKNPEETFTIWNRDSVLSDMVWTIRKFKPDVIICRFPTTGEGGHGHHTASAILAMEAFDAAADPKRFPHQLASVPVWKTRRIFWNTFNFGTTNTTAPNQLKVDVGLYNPLLGKGYGEIAAESRSMHKSQGFGVPKQRGSTTEYFKLLKGDSVKSDLFEGIDQTWHRFPGSADLEKAIQNCIGKFNSRSPELSIPDLLEIHKLLAHLQSKDPTQMKWNDLKMREIENLMVACSGLWLEAFAASNTGIPGNAVTLTTQVVKRNNCEAKLQKISYWNQQDTMTEHVLKTNELFTAKHTETLSANLPFSNPYWLNEKHEPGFYHVNDPMLIGKPENNPALMVSFYIELGGLQIEVERPLVYKWTDPVKGEIYSPFEVLPPATVNISEKVLVFSDEHPKNVQFVIKANSDNVSGLLMVAVPDGWSFVYKTKEFNLENRGEEVVLEGQVVSSKTGSNSKLAASVLIHGKIYSKGIQRIEYDHIPHQFILSDAEANLVHINLKESGTNIGYIPGAGDEIPVCLKQIGYKVTVLTDEQLMNDDLSKYSAIITGVRAYNTNERLKTFYRRLMDYTKNGGNLIVQYNTSNRDEPVTSSMGPYPFTISRDRVTDEHAEMRITNPGHSVLNWPNVIDTNDFKGWIQERGIYFAKDWDKQYETVFSINDPGEKPSEGSLIIAKNGKGNFVYTGLVFFRELPAGVPGAYRLLVNLLSLPQNK